MSDSRISGSKATVKLKIKVDSFFGFSLIIWILQTKNRLAVNRGFIETWHSPQWTAAVRQVPTVILQNLTEHPKSKYHKGSFKYFTSELKKNLVEKIPFIIQANWLKFKQLIWLFILNQTVYNKEIQLKQLKRTRFYYQW